MYSPKKVKRSKKVVKSPKNKGSRTRGWAKEAPRRVKERASMLKKCGSKCFLMPKEKKFPVCSKNCKLSCKGLLSAKIRASQYKYGNVIRRSTKLMKTHRC